jgi:hypothetical protein
MRLLLASTAIAAAMAFSPAFAQEAPAADTPPPVATTDVPPVSATGNETDGSLKVEGVTPSQALGAIDTEKLVQPESEAAPQTAQAEAAPEAEATETAEAAPDAEAEVTATAEAEPELQATDDETAVAEAEAPATDEPTETASAETDASTQIASAPEDAEALKELAAVEVDLPEEVLAVAAMDSYTTEQLVMAQLEAIENTPAPESSRIQPADAPVEATEPAVAAPASENGSEVFDGDRNPADWSQSAETPAASAPEAPLPEASDEPAEEPASETL